MSDDSRTWTRVVIAPTIEPGKYAVLTHTARRMGRLWQGNGFVREHGHMTAAEVLDKLIHTPGPVRLCIRTANGLSETEFIKEQD